MNGKKILATIAVSALLLTGCSFNHKAIVKVNGQPITQAQFDDTFNKAIGNSMFAQMGIDVKNDKNSFLNLMIKDRVINELIVKSLIEQEMVKRNIKVTKDDINEELALVIKKVGSKQRFEEILHQNKISTEQFKKDLTEAVKMKKLVRTITTVKVTDADAKKFYNANVSKFKFPEKVRASHILISANPEEIKQKIVSDPANKKLTKDEIQAKVDKELLIKKEKAEKILAEVKKDPASFEKIARENSDDTKSAKQGGDLGFFSKQEMVEPFAKAAFAQKPNTVSNIVQTPYGYHIIMVKDRTVAGQAPFEKVKFDIILYLENQKELKVLDNLTESLKKQAKIEYLNPEYDPKVIGEELKKQAKNNPMVDEEIHPEAKSATPKPETEKK